MLSRIRTNLTYANVMSTIAVVFAVGGGAAYAANSIGSGDIIDGQVKTADLANSAVTNPKLGSSAVGNSKIAYGAVTSTKILNGSIGDVDVAPNALTGAKIDESSLGQVPQAGWASSAGYAITAGSASTAGGAPPTGSAGGHLDGTFPNPTVKPAEGWTYITDMANGWTQDALYGTHPAYYKDRDDVVHIKGNVGNSSGNNQILEIPYPMCQRGNSHPFSQDEKHLVAAGSSFAPSTARIALSQGFDDSTGAWVNHMEIWHSGGSTTEVSLDGLSYRTCPLPPASRNSGKRPVPFEDR